MGADKKTETTNSNQTQTVAPDPSMVEANAIDLASKKKFQPTADLLNENAANFINSLFTGNIAGLGSIFGQVAQGSAGKALDDNVALGLRDVNTQLAKSGAGTFLESGSAQAAGTRAAAGMRQDSTQFDIGSILNLANLAVGGQAQIQQPINQQNYGLGQRLAGLSGYSSTGSSNTSTLSMNPFLRSFETQAGKTLGSGSFQSGPSGFFKFGG